METIEFLSNYTMLRPLTTLSLSAKIIDNLHKNGYYYVEDIDNNPEIVEKYVNSEMLKKSLNPPITLTSLDHWQAELQYQKLKTSSESLNDILDGGFQCGTITELCGIQGSGKTQVCFQASIAAQLPENVGGLEGQSLYIDTRNAFSCQRINGFRKLHPKLSLPTDKILENIFVSSPKSIDDLNNTITKLKKILKYSKNISIRAIIVDSLSFLICSTDDPSTRFKNYIQILDNLQDIASKYNLTVIVVNELVTQCDVNNEIYFVSAGGQNVANRCQKRLMLARISGSKFAARIIKSSVMPQVTVPFYITADGISDEI
ncbi:meiotic recombination protein dmc1-like isoform X2 [Chelonus insularis]|uniref:meiotic recombination protein dmc1-like isoform X2 n=1 Tax=Chelonus insularis TaxID=460826 RepID=UPI001588DFAB|nr:meiotic recombination protein dmc1-like isoform X2 [Chelonus insularis]